MFGQLKKFLKGNHAVPASEAGKTADELHIELMALPDVNRDFTTPEGAVLCLEDAYRRKDIEAAVAAKDFKIEAKLLLEKTGFGHGLDDAIIAKTAQALEMSFRTHTTARWPNFEGLESFFPKREKHSENIVMISEVCRFPDGLFSRQEILVAKTSDGWRVLNTVKKN